MRSKSEPRRSSFLPAISKGLVRAAYCAVLLMVITASLAMAQVSDPLPFEVQNPHGKHWSSEEAGRIYLSACDLVARSIRPDKPPHLQPRFRLLLGAESDQFVRSDSVNEIQLKSWDPQKFAEGVVAVAIRDMLHGEDLLRIAHQSVILANSTLDVRKLQGR